MGHQTPLSFLRPTGVSFFTCLHFVANLICIPWQTAPARPPELSPSLSPSVVHSPLHPLTAHQVSSQPPSVASEMPHPVPRCGQLGGFLHVRGPA